MQDPECTLVTCNSTHQRQSNIDYLQRLESFQHDLSQIFRMLALSLKELKYENASRNRSCNPGYYDSRLKGKVYEAYHQDVQIFCYEFGSTLPPSAPTEAGQHQTTQS